MKKHQTALALILLLVIVVVGGILAKVIYAKYKARKLAQENKLV